MTYTIRVNDETRTVDADDDTPLLWVLRDLLDLKGSKFGCGAARENHAARRQGHRRGDVGKCLPLLHLHAHPGRHQEGGRHGHRRRGSALIMITSLLETERSETGRSVTSRR